MDSAWSAKPYASWRSDPREATQGKIQGKKLVKRKYLLLCNCSKAPQLSHHNKGLGVPLTESQGRGIREMGMLG